MNDDDEIQRRKSEFFGYADDSQTNEGHFLSNRNYRIEPTKECSSCRANISANAIFCIHCSRRIEASESTGNELTDITWGENGAVFNQLSSHSASYDETRSNQVQHGENIIVALDVALKVFNRLKWLIESERAAAVFPARDIILKWEALIFPATQFSKLF